MGNQIIQSIKTIAQSLVDNAGYDKTRGGFIVGVNTVTNTYSVKVDGVTYPIVRAVDDATYNIGDVVKVVIPCNQATQMYISSSILSDNSLGNKIANATTLAEDAGKLGLDNQLEIKKVSDVANSKTKTFRQDTAPTEGMSSGDVWIDTSDNNTLYVYDGTQWVFSGGGTGATGATGAEGYSPTVSTGTSSDGSTTITVTNKDGSTTTELVDGTARDGVDSLNDSVYGVQTFEYILDGVTIPVHKREDGTYYYILNDEEVDVAESDLVHNSDGDLVSYQEGGIDESLNDITNNIDAINKEVDGFNAREDALYKSIQDNSLIARKNARVQQGSLIITNDTTTEKITDIKNYLQLDPQAIVIYREEDPIVLIGIAGDESENQVGGYMEMRGTSLFIAQESRLSTIRLRSADGIGSLALVAGSNGHVSLREVLN